MSDQPKNLNSRLYNPLEDFSLMPLAISAALTDRPVPRCLMPLVHGKLLKRTNGQKIQLFRVVYKRKR